MARFPELFGEAIDEVVMGEKLLVERWPSTSPGHILERQEALLGRGVESGRATRWSG